MADYDIGKAFEKIENELIASMIRNMNGHKVEEVNEEKEWAMWQALQLESLEQYKRKNKDKYKAEFADMNARIDEVIRECYAQGEMDQEIAILEAIKKGFHPPVQSPGMTGQFFKLNERKLEALIAETAGNVKKAEVAILRMANDKYRKVIFDAQVYANTGAATYEKAVDMATKDYLNAGINCIEYKNGTRVSAATYASMALRTANKRAYLQGEGNKRKEWGISTVIMNKRGTACRKCFKFQGKIFIDDVWSGGKASDGDYPLLSTAIAQGLYHPNCRDSHTTFFPGITKKPRALSKEEKEQSIAEYDQEQKQNYVRHEKKRFARLAAGSLDKENKKVYENASEKMKYHELKKSFVDEQTKIITQSIENLGKNGYNVRTAEEYKTVANEYKELVEKYSSNSSKWSGNILVDNQRLIQEGAIGLKEWSCDISLIDTAEDDVLIHELLHSCSASYYPPDVYSIHQCIEEASVEFLKQQICYANGIQQVEAYEDYVIILKEINNAFHYGTDFEFAKQLFNVPLPDRYIWFEDLVVDSLKANNASFEDFNEVISFIRELKGGS